MDNNSGYNKITSQKNLNQLSFSTAQTKPAQANTPATHISNSKNNKSKVVTIRYYTEDDCD